MGKTLALALLVVMVACGPTGDEATATKLIDALHRYQTDKGRYPESLEALVPGYVADLPEGQRSDENRPYAYRLENGEFTLAYSVGFKVSRVYYSGSRTWTQVD